MPVPKPDGTVRLCIDCRCLNEVTVSDAFYMPTFDELFEKVRGAIVLSKFDLSKGYHQVVVAKESQERMG